jgi:hypothetical protein
MSLSERLSEYVEACFTGLWIQSHEHEDALAEIARLCHERQWRLALWDIERGLQVPGEAAEDAASSDPLAAIRAVNSLAVSDSAALLVLVNFHRFINSAEVVQALARQITSGKQNRTFVVIVSPIVQIPSELEKQIVVLEHDLPDREQLGEIARGIATEAGELPTGDEQTAVLDAAAGLTRYEAESAFSLSLVRDGAIRPRSIWELKSQMLKKSGLLSLYRGSERFDDLGGLDALKSFCSRALRRQGHPDPLKRPRGVLLLGVPGTGKSAFAKSLGNETGRPTLMMDIGRLLGSLVGQSESNLRQSLRIADAMAPSILYMDEVEKALSGVESSGQTDSGVSARMFGAFLTWLNDHTSDVFVIATCNNIAHLPPAFSRAERFDGVFFLDLPDAGQRRAIWDLYIERFGLSADQTMPTDADFTGAEIKACCRLAALLDVPLIEASQNVVPVSRTAGESVRELRQWANGRCLSADHQGLYRFGGGGSGKRRRSIPRDPSAN